MQAQQLEASQAAADVRMIRETIERARRRVVDAGGGHIMIIWGIAWVIGYGGTHFFADPYVGPLWIAVNTTAGIASAIASRRCGGHVQGRGESRIWLLWLCLAAYGILWIWMFRPASSNEIGLFIGSLAMLGYVVMGLWLASRFLSLLGAAITVFAVVGFLLLPSAFSLWMAATGGGGLIAGGIYALRTWR